MGFFSELLDASEDHTKTYINSVITGIVKEIWNTKYPGMVNVEYILSDTEQKVTDWIRVATPYGGNSYGMYAYPEIGTEVVIAFVMGDINSPIIIGCLWNKEDALPKDIPTEENRIKAFLTKGGNQILVSDEEGKESIQVMTKGKLSVQLTDENKTIEIADEKKKNKISIDSSKGEVTITAESKLTLTAGSSSITLDDQAGKIQVSTNQLAMEGKQSMEFKTNSSLKAQGAMVELKAQSNFKAESGAMMQIKGAMTKIN